MTEASITAISRTVLPCFLFIGIRSFSVLTW
jgi:hypothetical protein